MIFASDLKANSHHLPKYQHITKAIVRAEDCVDGITLYTDKGTKFQAGGQGGTPYAIFAPKDMQIVAFKSALGDGYQILCLL